MLYKNYIQDLFVTLQIIYFVAFFFFFLVLSTQPCILLGKHSTLNYVHSSPRFQCIWFSFLNVCICARGCSHAFMWQPGEDAECLTFHFTFFVCMCTCACMWTNCLWMHVEVCGWRCKSSWKLLFSLTEMGSLILSWCSPVWLITCQLVGVPCLNFMRWKLQASLPH